MSQTSLLLLNGRDTLDLLHRISTQAMLDLPVGEARLATFCDFRGRLLHRVWAARTGDDAVWLLRPDAPGDALMAFIDRSVFREDVRVSDHSGEAEVMWIEPGEFAAHRVVEREGRPVRVRAARGPALEVLKRDDTAAMDARPLDDRQRVLRGVAAQGHEIVEDFTPYEVNLGDALHLDKGCFPGQEALQRLVTHDSVRRRLFRVQGSGPVPAVPAEVLRVGAPIGRLTSATADAALGWIGLAVLRHDARDANDLELADGTAVTHPAAFPLARPLGRPWPAED